MSWFFHCAPSIVLDLDVEEFLLWERQMVRIAQLYRTAISER